jgi:hypothetical protein
MISEKELKLFPFKTNWFQGWATQPFPRKKSAMVSLLVSESRFQAELAALLDLYCGFPAWNERATCRLSEVVSRIDRRSPERATRFPIHT